MKQQKHNNDQPELLSGVVSNIIYRSEDTGYTVCTISQDSISAPKRGLLATGSGRDAITIVGTCAAIWVGENMKATGTWTRHRRHGYQFQAEKIECMAPVTSEGIKLYLSSGMIKGIGEVTAERLVNAFGNDTLHIIEKESKRLMDVPGIGKKTRDKIKNSWDEHRAMRDIMIFLRGHGVGTAQATRIFRQYGEQAVAVVSANPYRLCKDVWGIGFRSADTIAMNMGISKESEVRARAGILYTLETMADDGHCFCPWEALLEEGQALLDIPTHILDTALKYEIEHKIMVEDEGNVYMAPLYHAEKQVARRVKCLCDTPSKFRPIETDKALPWAADRMDMSFAPAQSAALKTALSEKVTIITGGPGVGKTTIVRALVDVFRQRRLQVVLAAPTGRAAKRMSEATGFTASTIHRLLKFQPGLGGFEHGAENPLEGDVFILDEVSMIDISLMQSFISSLEPHSVLVLVGDGDQLPSIGPGNVLKDMINSGTVPAMRLDEIYRQKSESLIVYNAHRVNRGERLDTETPSELSDFYFIKSDDPEDTIRRLLELVTSRIPAKFGLNAQTDIQVLTPMRKNQLGADNLNAILQSSLNPKGTSIIKFGRTYRQRDRVMQIRNNYDKDIFNGDIGLVTHVDEHEQNLIVDFDDRKVNYDYKELDELVLAYACSIHKSQGSEYPAVIILMATQHFKLLQRNLLYTAITRGRKLVCLIGSNKAVMIATKNNKIILRRTTLAKRICQELDSGRWLEPAE